MTLPGTGPISFSQVNVELGRSSDQTISLDETPVRTLAGKSTGSISASDLLGKSAGVTFDLEPGNYEYSARGTKILKITANKECVWSYTRSGTGVNVPTSNGQTSSSFQMQVTAPNPNDSRYCQWNLEAYYNGTTYYWVIFLLAVGTNVA